MGKRLGKLLVVEELDKRKNRYRVWKCKCDCGNYIELSTKDLRQGSRTDCGCLTGHRLGPKAEELTGRHFGKLVVLSRDKNTEYGKVQWRCRCTCGKETTVLAMHLKSGKVQSCGCDRRERHPSLDLTGMRFRMLTVICKTDKRDKKGSVIWKCKCDCGKETKVSADRLLHGGYVSCGCHRVDLGKKLNQSMVFVDGTCIDMLEKRKGRSDNTSGHAGVYPTKTGKYKASIGLAGKRYHLGTYTSFENAVMARELAEKSLHAGVVDAYRMWIARQENRENGDAFSFDVVRNDRQELEIVITS